MKAVRAAGDGVVVDDVDEPPGLGELLDMQATSVCASDLMYIRFGLQKILDEYGIFLERVAVMDYRFDPDYLKVITEKKVAEAKTLEIRAQMEAQREANKRLLNEAEGQVKSIYAQVSGRYSLLSARCTRVTGRWTRVSGRASSVSARCTSVSAAESSVTGRDLQVDARRLQVTAPSTRLAASFS